MRRLAPLLAALALVALPAVATGHDGPGGGPGGDAGARGDDTPRGGERDRPGRDAPPFWAADEAVYMFHGEVESVDAGAGTLQVLVHHARGPFGRPDDDADETDDDDGGAPGASASRRGHSGPRGGREFSATFHTDADTGVYRNGEEATLADLQAGDVIAIAIAAEPGLTPEQAAAQPAWMIAAHERQAFYGFGGRVTGVDEDANTVTLSVRWATRGARSLLTGTTLPAEMTFTLSDETRLGGGDPEVGDIAGVGIVGSRTATLEEVLATPAEVVIGLSRRRASTRTMARLGTRAARSARAGRR